MGRTYDAIPDAMREFIERQHVFFVATAPRDGGHVNVSPKGYDSFRVLDPNRVAFLDLTGSGVETIAHVRENGRITFMFCAFEGPPNIVRLYGNGEVIDLDDPRFAELRGQFGSMSGGRAIIVADVHRTSTSCGYAVPRLDFVEERSRLDDVWASRSDEEITTYWAEKNAASIDGLPGLA
jgi:hypothetical protein